MTKETAELVFIPTPGAGHLVSMAEIAKKLVERDDRLSVTILIMTLPEFGAKPTTFAQSLTTSGNNSSSASRIKFVNLPDDEDEENEEPGKQKAPRPMSFFFKFIESRKPHVKEVVNKLISESAESPDSPRLAGFVLDMFFTCMMDVADEFNVPSYIFFTSGAAFLGFMLHVQGLRDEGNLETTELKDSDAEVKLPCLVNSVPSRVWPSSFTNGEMVDAVCGQVRRYRDAKGIIVNTFEELESYAVKSFSDGKAMTKTPDVYAVGPLLSIDGHNYNLGPGGAERKAEIMTWLDDQPDSSVVFLCFGSMGSFGEEQVKEIAWALEQSGFRFLWSLRRAPAKDNPRKPTDYDDFTGVLPEGFLDRTAGVGKVTGWAPQVAVLSHPAVGGFVSHCGWNSTLESLWFGVPMATWPLYAEQQFNAFELVVELGLAVEIKMDYYRDFTVENPTIVGAQVIEGGIRCLMEHGSEVRMKVKEMSEKGRQALLDGGSSFRSMGRLIDDVMSSL